MLRPILGLLLAAAVTPCAYAAESYDNCTGFITTLPATISTQGTWCLNGNLATAITAGNAITVTANNVTIDCNDFKVGGLASGENTAAVGIYSQNILNTTIRHCGIRGFLNGVQLSGDQTSGGLVEDNRFDQNTVRAILMEGGGHVVRRNRIVDTGGSPGANGAIAIHIKGSESLVADNLISGMTVATAGGSVIGIGAVGGTSEVARNMITGLVPNQGPVRGILLGVGSASLVRSNTLLSNPSMLGNGITAGAGNLCSDNKVVGYSLGFAGGCSNGGGNSNKR